jgi:hypothetical protein
MAKPALDCPSVMASIGQRKAASMSKHVGVDLDLQTGPSPLDHLTKACWRERRSAFADEDERALMR